MGKKTFLSAKWEYLIMFNYEVDPLILSKYVPPGTEIDYFNNKAMVSIVGFLFNETKVLGLKWPWHVNFEEANLRLYVKRFDGIEWKRGVAFISEIVPKPIVARLANLFYNEHYSSAKMNHQIINDGTSIKVGYGWKNKNKFENRLMVTAKPELREIMSGSEEEFIFEHYFGYNQLDKKRIIEYAVSHPRWEVFPVTDYSIECDIENLYGNEFVPFLKDKQPHSVFLAKGSEVTVKMPVKIKVYGK